MSILERKRQMRAKWAENAKQCEWRGDIKLEEVQKHNDPKDCWAVINGDVYDFTQYISQHPGGSRVFLNANSKDITDPFFRFHPNLELSFIEKLKIGKLVK